MTINQAIEKAIGGGWNNKMGIFYRKTGLQYPNEFFDYPVDSIFDDPLFWHALVNAMKWNLDVTIAELSSEGVGVVHTTKKWERWVEIQHRFVDHLAEGGNAQSFFKSL